ncbi:PREDICTED: uncharacterized protein LOC109352901 [Lupinus angustifolius]|uniref:uncharacterized protein LOC109352901 n=1 Tax=Lupinus angustifolius TaxID=3871 RepID=UPI00092F7882|nr:PREDICTED: uncharacterized protein LOC109352901 [Lupinus angustifolius]
MIVLLTHARVKEGQGKYLPTVSNSWCGSKILIDDEILDYLKYKDSFVTFSLSCDSLSQGNTQLSQYSNLSDDDRFMYKAEEITCVTIGTTAMFIIGKQGWYYDGCLKCTKKVDVKDEPFTCKCGTYNLSSTPRYKLDIKVIHENGSGRFVFWDRQRADIIGVSACELRNQMVAEGEDDPKAFPIIFDMLLTRTMTFRVKVQPFYHQSFMIMLYESPILIKAIADHKVSPSEELNGKFHVNDISQHESSVFVTTDHDPDNLQVETPAKRMSADFDLEIPQSPHFKSTQLSSSKMAKHIKKE